MNTSKIRILIIEDEPDIQHLLKYNLKQDGYQVLTSNNGETGLEMAQTNVPDLILLDLMLPGIQGLHVCRLLKSEKKTNDIFIIMLTALGQEEDIIDGLENGADDYITKPFSYPVLEARIRSVLKRSKNIQTNNKAITIHGLKIDPRSRETSIDDSLIELTYTEFEILHLLASHPGWVFTRYQIIDKIKGDNYPVTDRSVDFQIVGLRKKMQHKGILIETIRGVGYRFNPDDS